jgi:hypothetical protein
MNSFELDLERMRELVCFVVRNRRRQRVGKALERKFFLKRNAVQRGKKLEKSQKACVYTSPSVFRSSAPDFRQDNFQMAIVNVLLFLFVRGRINNIAGCAVSQPKKKKKANRRRTKKTTMNQDKHPYTNTQERV